MRGWRHVLPALLLGLLASQALLAQEGNFLPSGLFQQGLRGIGNRKSLIDLDGSVKHGGAQSLKVIAPEGGSAFVNIEDMDLRKPIEISAWVLTTEDSKARIYLDAEAPSGGRAIRGQTEALRARRWTQLKAIIEPTAWEPGDSGFSFHCYAEGTAWFDELTVRVAPAGGAAFSQPSGKPSGKPSSGTGAKPSPNTTKPPSPPKPDLGAQIAAKGPTVLKLSGAQIVDATGRASKASGDELALAVGETAIVPVRIEQEGYYLFSLEVEDAAGKSGPQVEMLLDDQILGVSPFAIPASPGKFSLRKFSAPLVASGEHRLRIVGPGQAVGKFRKITLTPVRRTPEKPLYWFLLANDTRVGEADSRAWPLSGRLGDAVSAISQAASGRAPKFLIATGGLTASGAVAEFGQVAGVVSKLGCPWYACLGPSDRAPSGSLAQTAAALGRALPGGKTWYVYDDPPLRFLVLDASWRKTKSGKYVESCPPEEAAGFGMPPQELEWLEMQLSANPERKTVLVVHGALVTGHSEPGKPPPTGGGAFLGADQCAFILERHSQVVAVLAGDADRNAMTSVGPAIHVRNAALGRYPFVYKRVTVYPTHLEVTTHQLTDRALVGDGAGVDGNALGRTDDLYSEVPM